MKKIKKFYKEHRVFTILMAIVIVCAILIATVLIQCFYVGNGKNKYGHRLDGIENYEISEAKQSDFKNNIANNDKVRSVEIEVTGKIIYITMQIEDNVDIVEAESIALKSLEEFSEEEQKVYDFNITLKQNSNGSNEGFYISGAKNVNGSGLIWNNNRKVVKEEPVTE
ncbi:MAG: hypothetical protein K2H20_01055 [Bacilli bacterium]|nr:hypothetical protein [Bacilli bacterium]